MECRLHYSSGVYSYLHRRNTVSNAFARKWITTIYLLSRDSFSLYTDEQPFLSPLFKHNFFHLKNFVKNDIGDFCSSFLSITLSSELCNMTLKKCIRKLQSILIIWLALFFSSDNYIASNYPIRSVAVKQLNTYIETATLIKVISPYWYCSIVESLSIVDQNKSFIAFATEQAFNLDS